MISSNEFSFSSVVTTFSLTPASGLCPSAITGDIQPPASGTAAAAPRAAPPASRMKSRRRRYSCSSVISDGRTSAGRLMIMRRLSTEAAAESGLVQPVSGRQRQHTPGPLTAKPRGHAPASRDGRVIQSGMPSGRIDPRWPKLLSLAVHEFRSPLTVVSGYIRMLLTERAGPVPDAAAPPARGGREILRPAVGCCSAKSASSRNSRAGPRRFNRSALDVAGDAGGRRGGAAAAARSRGRRRRDDAPGATDQRRCRPAAGGVDVRAARAATRARHERSPRRARRSPATRRARSESPSANRNESSACAPPPRPIS